MLFDYRKALGYYQRLLEMRQAGQHDDQSQVATSLNAVGMAYYKLGDYVQTLLYSDRALQVSQYGEHTDVA